MRHFPDLGATLARVGLVVALALLGVATAIVVVAAAADYRSRDSAPEAVARSYFGALEDGDLDAALETLDPSIRQASRTFVTNLLNNEYRVEGVAVSQPSLLSRIRGEDAGPRDVTIFLAITQSVDGVRWEAGPRVPLVREGDRWYLGRPPLSG